MERHSTFTQMRHFVVGSWICALASLAWLASFVVTPESWNGIGESWRAWVIAREHAEFAELANARAAGPEAEIRALERWIDGHASVTASTDL